MEQHLLCLGTRYWTEEYIDIVAEVHHVERTDVIIHLTRAVISMLKRTETKEQFELTVSRHDLYFYLLFALIIVDDCGFGNKAVCLSQFQLEW
jgi:hypothetical protein